MRIISTRDTAAVAALLGGPAPQDDAATRRRAGAIVAAVRARGDAALIEYARRLDGLDGPVEVPRESWAAGAASVPAPVRRAIRTAAANIRRVARAQKPRGFRVQVAPGVRVEQRPIPLDSVGCYVPGGRYPLPSSLLMTAIPARVAGVGNVVATCPRIDGSVLAAAMAAGIDRLFAVGGAHAVAALAYGTESVPRVDRIVGPGNRWVSAAKAIVSADCAIDFHAGPSEIVIVSGRGRPEWIAADMLAQAEHDPDARAVLITWKRALARSVARCLAASPFAREPAAAALARHGGIIVARSPGEAMARANASAPEHLVVDDEDAARMVRAAGSVFVGSWTAQVAGDYAIGSNHVLPTAGAARFRGGLGTADFVRLVSVQRLTRAGFARIAPAAAALARAEGLEAHAASIAIRSRPEGTQTTGRGETSPQQA